MIKLFRIAAPFALWLPIAAQQIQLQGPANGWIFDNSSRSIRPILGSAGSALLGSPIMTDLDFASIAPNARSALVVKAGRLNLIRDLSSPDTSAVVLDSALQQTRRILWSADSTAAILGAAQKVQRISNLQAEPSVEFSMRIAPPRPGGGAILATDATAKRIVVEISENNARRLLLISESGETAPLGELADPAAAAFSQDGRDLYVADRGSGQVVIFRNVGAGASATPILDGVGDVVALNAGSQLLVATRAPSRIRAYNASTWTLSAECELDSEPEIVEAVPGSSYFRLTSLRRSGDTLWLVDIRDHLSAFFVPGGESQ